MGFWTTNFSRSFGDAFQLFGGGKIVIGTIILAITFVLISMYRSHENAKNYLINGSLSLLVTLIIFIMWFFVLLFFISPVRIYNEQRVEIAKLESETKALHRQISNAQDQAVKSSPIFQKQMLIRRELQNLGSEFNKMSIGFLKGGYDAFTGYDWQTFYEGDVNPVIKKARFEGLDTTKIEELLSKMKSPEHLRDRETLFHATSLECEVLANQLPSKN